MHITHLPIYSYRYPASVVRTPNTSHTLVDTLHGLRDPLQLLSARIPQKLRFLHYLTRLHIPYTDDFMASVDVVARYHRMFVWSWRDCYLDLGVGGGKSGEFVLKEGPVRLVRRKKHGHYGKRPTSCPLSFRPHRSSGNRDVCIEARRHQRHSGKSLVAEPIPL